LSIHYRKKGQVFNASYKPGGWALGADQVNQLIFVAAAGVGPSQGSDITDKMPEI